MFDILKNIFKNKMIALICLGVIALIHFITFIVNMVNGFHFYLIISLLVSEGIVALAAFGLLKNKPIITMITVFYMAFRHSISYFGSYAGSADFFASSSNNTSYIPCYIIAAIATFCISVGLIAYIVKQLNFYAEICDMVFLFGILGGCAIILIAFIAGLIGDAFSGGFAYVVPFIELIVYGITGLSCLSYAEDM